MWCDIHVVRRWEWKGSSSDHCCGQEVTAGTEEELGTPWGWAACALDTDQPFLWQMSWSETSRQASGWLHLLDSQKRTPGSWVLLAFCYWFSRASNDISVWRVWTKDGPTYKIKALGPRDPLSASLSVETWAVSSLWLWVLWLLGSETNTRSAHVAWLAEFPTGMLQPLLVIDWAIYLWMHIWEGLGLNQLEIESNLSLTCHVDFKREERTKTLEYSAPGWRSVDCQGAL